MSCLNKKFNLKVKMEKIVTSHGNRGTISGGTGDSGGERVMTTIAMVVLVMTKIMVVVLVVDGYRL